MSSTRTHDLACIVIGTTLQITGITVHPCLHIVGAGSFLGLLLSPDLDWDGHVVQNKATGRKYLRTEAKAEWGERNIRRVYGRVLERWPEPLKSWWKLYARLFGHRKLSHHWGWGTLTRLVWLGFPIPLTFVFTNLILVWLGLYLADLGHILLDSVRIRCNLP